MWNVGDLTPPSEGDLGTIRASDDGEQKEVYYEDIRIRTII
jgi:hypothetical protein